MHRGGKLALTPAQQHLFLRSNPICTGDGYLTNTSLVWNYRTRPTLLSREYGVHIVFDKRETPDVFIRNPDLSALARERNIPHVYKYPTRLCLYLPGSGEWKDTMRIDQTFVPWTATWLYYFEEWLESDEWKGGGEHPGDAEGAYNRRVRRSAMT
jgi:hypothetical protein